MKGIGQGEYDQLYLGHNITDYMSNEAIFVWSYF